MLKGPKPHLPPGSGPGAPGKPSQPNVFPKQAPGGPVGIGSAGDSAVTNAAKKKPKHGKPNVPPKGSQFSLRKEGKPNKVPGFRK